MKHSQTPVLYFNCHQNWDNMTPTESGRYCGICQKEVIDFTSATTDEINSFKNKYQGELCGRFIIYPDPDLIAPVTAPKFIKKIALLSSFILAAITHKSNAQSPTQGMPEQTEQTCVNPSASQIRNLKSYGSGNTEKPDYISPNSHILSTKRKELYWLKRFPFIKKVSKPVYSAPTLVMGRML